MTNQTAKTCPDCGPSVRLYIVSEAPLFDGLADIGETTKILQCLVCDYHEPLPPDLLMAAVGAAMLPGMEEA